MGTPAPSVTVELPYPPAELSPNAREPWAARYRAAREYKQTCYVLARSAMHGARGLTFPLTPPVLMRLTWVLPTRGRRDYDNLTARLKPGIDGLVAAGLLRDDDSASLVPLEPSVEYARPGCVRVELRGAA